MRRIHLFEFNDLPGLPQPLRKTILEFLQHMSVQLRLYEAGFASIERVLEKVRVDTLQALCAGDGGLVAALVARLKRQDLRVVLSDKNPELDSLRERERESGGRIQFIPESVDALDVPEQMKGLRLVVNAVHHFPAPLVRAMLADAVAKQQPIIFLEPVQRDVLSVLRFMVASPLLCLYMSLGGIWPPSPRRLLLGALVPVGTLAFVFDGIVSHLRAYTVEEWQAMIREIPDHERFEWEVRYQPGFMGSRITFLSGIPKDAAASAPAPRHEARS